MEFEFLKSHGLSQFEQWAILGVLATAFLSLLYAWWLRGTVLKKDKGTEKMQAVWSAIKIGANSYLDSQFKKILPAMIVLTVVMFCSVYVLHLSPSTKDTFKNYSEGTTQLIVAIGRTLAFLMGASFSLIVGRWGMRMAIEANVRCASAAKRDFTESLTIAYYAGTITGMLTDGLGLLGGTLIFIYFGKASPDILLGFGFGGTLLALFMRVGGGIYTKAADVGADLVGKVEKDIPEDDPRNAAVVADLVGDNVGDCAGMAADIFESYEVTIVSSMILGIFLYQIDGNLVWIVYPLIIRGIGVISSILGTFTVPIWERIPIPFLRAHDAQEAMFRSYEVSSVNTIVWAFLVADWYAGDWRLAMLTTIGVGLAVAFNPLTAYFTDTKRKPVKELVKSTGGGPATTILSGLSLGMESSVWALVLVCVSFVSAWLLYLEPGSALLAKVPADKVAEFSTYCILYAIAMVGIGMLSHTGNNVAMDSYGPISDNANGIGEMAWHDQEDVETKKARQILADLDAVGNTTKAITKGVAIASAVIAAVSLFASYIADVRHAQEMSKITDHLIKDIRISETTVFIGFLLGGALPWLFSALSIRSVARGAYQIVQEVRRQFKIPGVMEGTLTPDYAKVVAISTKAAQKELMPLAVISVVIPLAVGLLLGVEALGGYLAGSILCGQMLAVFMSNAGGAWDNAKKSVEDEVRDVVKNTGKGSERHKASVVGDTVGDPLKDTAGPALNPMIKVVNLISLIAAPIIVQYQTSLGVYRWVIVGALLAAFVWAVLSSKTDIPDVESMKEQK